MAGASSSAESSARICVRCGQDCSNKRRVKDAQGRYCCQPCFEQLAAERAARQAPGKDASREASAKAPPPSAAPAPAPTPQDAPGPEEPMIDLAALAAAESLVQAGPRVQSDEDIKLDAPQPKSPRRPGSVLSGTIKKCGKCGYSMDKVPSLKCPECGHVNPSRKEQVLRDTERETVRNTYARPIIMATAGIAITFVLLAIGKAPWEAYALEVGELMIRVPVGVLTFFICSLIFLEYDEPFHLTALRLAGIYAVVGIPDALMVSLGMPGFRAFHLLQLGLLILLFMSELDLEKWEAVAMAFIGWLVMLGLLVGLLVLLNTMLVQTG